MFVFLLRCVGDARGLEHLHVLKSVCLHKVGFVIFAPLEHVYLQKSVC